MAEVAIVAHTKPRAKALAEMLGIKTRWLYGRRCASSFEGLRADTVIIEAYADIPDDFMKTIRHNVLKSGGSIEYATLGVQPD
ncbi:hypothetical protein [Mycobacterium sp. CnD-18-1]|uniref:hypothetical protein n=1 Tax=Mycobacterium sp. CnD-18-1 TaxID=2917744 RepID=UPI001EF30231|nr:hypothetical protein [Mycobacterium sp. CnD-18-1]MCG7607100.1 hypothetical protein [Mycobacterium sp. CnD-18-1]